jgi:hypothetical protein
MAIPTLDPTRESAAAFKISRWLSSLGNLLHLTYVIRLLIKIETKSSFVFAILHKFSIKILEKILS